MPENISLTQLIRGLPESLNVCTAAEYRAAVAELKKRLARRTERLLRAKAKLKRFHKLFFSEMEACQRIDRSIAKLEEAHATQRKDNR